MVADSAQGDASLPILPPSRRWRLIQIWAAITLLLAVRAFADGVLSARGPRAGPGATSVCIDLNRASVGELQALPGIGPSRAEAIVLHRVRHGPFHEVGDLRRVDGIGEDTIAQLRPFASAEPLVAGR